MTVRCTGELTEAKFCSNSAVASSDDRMAGVELDKVREMLLKIVTPSDSTVGALVAVTVMIVG